MQLSKLINIQKKSVISIVGAGGKTSLMYKLSSELLFGKVLMTTSTKIYKPKEDKFDYIYIGRDKCESLKNHKDKGIYVYAIDIDENNKLIGEDVLELDKINKFFDYSIIEADGSKTKPIKGWNDSEPVICSTTDITIGVLTIGVVGKTIDDENVHRLDKFKKLIGDTDNGVVTLDNLVSVIFNENGLFKNSKGRRVVFINQVEGDTLKNLSYELLEKIKEENKEMGIVDSVIIGSLKEENFESFNL